MLRAVGLCFTLMIFGLSPQIGKAQSNEGTDFWLAFMQHFNGTENFKTVMITSKFNTTGTISVPGRNWSRPFAVQANDVVLIDMPEFTQILGSEAVTRLGIHVVSQQPISVYMHQYFTFRAEAATVLPTDAIGKEYFTMSYEGGTWFEEGFPSQIAIVGTKDLTTVNVTLAADSRSGRAAGSSFSVVLDQGETYQIRANGQADLTGTYIVADEPIAVFSGNAWTQIPGECGFRDNLMEQMYPVSTLGTEFATIPFKLVTYDIYRVLATEDNTSVQVMGSGPISFSLDRGEYREYTRSTPAYIVANKPIMVAQYMIGSSCNLLNIGDPAMLLLNSVEQTKDTVTLFNSSLQNIRRNFINVIAATDDVPNIFLDGVNLSDAGQTFREVGSGSGFSYAQVEVDNGAHTLISEGCGVIASAYGYGEFESYAYGGGASFRDINENPLPEGGCLNDTVFFELDLPEERYSIEWDIGVVPPVFENSFWHIYDALGTYPARAIVFDACLMKSDTFDRELLITLRQAADSPTDIRICEGEEIALSAEDLAGAKYEWRGPNGFFAEEQFPIIFDAKPNQSGPYEVIGIISGCASFPSFTEVEVVATPAPELGNDTIFCSRDGVDFTLEPGFFSSYQWQDGSNLSFFRVLSEGVYIVDVVDPFGCVGSDTIVVIEQCPTKTFLPNVFTPNGDSRNDVFGVLGNDIVRMTLQVFDRWGSLVFESRSVDQAWDGTVNGKPAPAGVYTWRLSYEGFDDDAEPIKRTLNGNTTLLR